MAEDDPIAAAAFWGGLRVATARFSLGEALSHTRTRGGEILVADQGARLWTGTVELWQAHHDAADAVMARIEALQMAGAALMVHPLPRPGPIHDPDGLTLGAATPVIASLAPNARALTLSGLPAGYLLAPGDMLGFPYGSPVKYALHRVVVGSTAGAGGSTGLLEVVPGIRPGASLGTPVSLVRPAMKALIIPGSVNPGQGQGIWRRGIAFSVVQTLR
ncbi:hypothetical protein [Pontitalea aquivivens]|uniref:hypothetical protein n=1 Tax=Pontitalea aquivivens TaxID=3388663 RepID=UPI003970569B